MEAAVEQLLCGKIEKLPEFEPAQDSYHSFLMNTARRLERAFVLYRDCRDYEGDFLLALRDYLIVFCTTVSLPDGVVPDGNVYSIHWDSEDGKYYATQDYPEYIDGSFCDAAFQRTPLQPRDEQLMSCYTDPMIRQITGFTRFRSAGQKLIVYGALKAPKGYTVLLSLPTGGGKSLITQTLAYQTDGLTVVVVPTVSLAMDQVRSAQGIFRSPSANEEILRYNSDIDRQTIIEKIRERKARLLFISPEALIKGTELSNAIRDASDTLYLKNIVIDEAHIVIDWGESFRVTYQFLASWCRDLVSSNRQLRTFLLSATFEEANVSTLKRLFAVEDKWIQVRCDELRHEPRFCIIKAKSRREKNRMMIELIRKLPHPMIVYVQTPEDAVNIAAAIQAAGIKNVETFTGATEDEDRQKRIDQWIKNDFSIMVATSAFGVGVDKSDVRTVLHVYLPDNPNAYYQELGRGGRDQLPCLSVLCYEKADVDSTRNRIAKRVMTAEKIIDRWNAMYLSTNANAVNGVVYIDTTITPEYRSQVYEPVAKVSRRDVDWNVYVLLVLWRHNVIEIEDVIPVGDAYRVGVRVLNPAVLPDSADQEQLIEAIRADEWEAHLDAFKRLKSAIDLADSVCLSEMFNETYALTFGYCGGCNAHPDVIEDNPYEFPLHVSIPDQFQTLTPAQLVMFGPCRNLIFYTENYDWENWMSAILGVGLSALVAENPDQLEQVLQIDSKKTSIMLLTMSDLKSLLQKNNFYYISGVLAVIYGEAPEQINKTLTYLTNKVYSRSNVRIIHIISRNVYLPQREKEFASVVDGKVVSLDELKRLF